MPSTSQKIAFLGFCERSAHIRDDNTDLFKWNILGLKNIILSHIYPLRLSRIDIGLAINASTISNKIVLKIKDMEDTEIGF
jgi:hypothetical protein